MSYSSPTTIFVPRCRNTRTMNNTSFYFYWLIWTLLLFHTAAAQVCAPACQNGGMCQDTSCGMGTTPPPCCTCAGTGYIGAVCNIPIQTTCTPQPCLNGGVCTVDPQDMKGYRCTCSGGYSGAICEFSGNSQCTSTSQCNGAICRNEMCDCSSIGDYYGPSCEMRKAIVGFENPSYSFREGSGVVDDVRITREFETGIQTDVQIIARAASSQQLVYRAIEGVDFVLQETTETFSVSDTTRRVNIELMNDDLAEGDEYFELELQISQSSVGQARLNGDKRTTLIKIEGGDGVSGCNAPSGRDCMNQGTCNADGSCLCPPEWTGAICETLVTAVNPCDPNPCKNNGVCSQTGTNQFSCECEGTGFEGTTCEAVNQPAPPGGLSTTVTIVIAVCAVVVVLVIAIAIGCWYCNRRGRRNKHGEDYASRQRGDAKDNTYAPRVQYKASPKGQHRRQGTVYDKAERKIGTEFPRQRLTLHEHLGSGAFANVVRADAMGIVKKRANTIVAVKMLKEMATETDRTDFMKELKVYRMLEPHPNIIAMLGSCTDKEPYYLIIEYAPHGNLQSHLRGIRNAPERPYSNLETNRKDFLTPNEALQFSSEIANGMCYLASKQCIHRDLATRNILLGDGLVCKLSDFGLARDISEGNSYEMQSRGRVPVRWMAPESLLENTYTTKSDVWSFAVTMWEIVTVGSHPYPGMSSKRVIDDLQQGFRLPKPEHCSDEIYAMMKQCWQERPENRPTFDEIHRQLERMLEDAQGYLVMTDFNVGDYVYLDPDQASESSVENDEHIETAGVV